ncbi:MAG: sugar transporter sugar-binding protein [Bacillota bacterium]|jgi:putative multiple sugar transport system substrate-binding protein|nr:sugar transporter sugar-binding protein [Bacillota bacterium]
MKKLIALLMVLALVLSLAACGGGEKPAPEDGATDEAAMIGVSMPTQSLQRWNQDGSNMKAKLEEAGYKVDLQYGGDNDIPTQVAQIENMITEGCKVLVIAAIDGSSLTEVLKQAKEQNIPVVAYDRLIMNSDAVSYYATFDNYQVGVMQGQYIETALDLKNQKGPFNVELFTGDPADNNATFFFNGAMSVLQPYIDSGVVVVPSGQTTQAQVSTQDWKTENAQSRMENLITSNGYSPKGKKLDAVMCSNDSTALGAVNALVSAGYTKDDMPIVTGQDCDKPNVKNMLQGLQSMSVFKDTRTLADKVVGMVDSIVKGSEPDINDKETYDNGTGVIPSYLCAPVVGTIDNYKELLIDSGYYKESDIQ